MNTKLPVAASMGALAGLLSATALAQGALVQPTTYRITVDPPTAIGEASADRGKSLAQITLRPTGAVVLQGTLDPAVATRAAVTAKFPFVPGRLLYATESRPGLYCDLMRNRGLGSSTACLRDNDQDGDFDEAVRFDFNSGGADMVFITDKGKVRGGRLKLTVPLAAPLVYAEAPDAVLPEARMELLWTSERKRKDPSDAPTTIELLASDGPNFTGTEIFADRVAQVAWRGRPVTIGYYGAEVSLLGFTPEGALRYTVEAGGALLPMNLVFRGYRLVIIGY